MHDLDRTQLEAQGYAGYRPVQRGAPPGATGLASEWQEAEQASALLEVTNEQELEHFLGGLVSGAARAAGSFLRSSTGRAVTGMLKDAARKALPSVGRAIGERIAPGGGAIGAGLAERAGRLLGLELEGLSAEDREFEAAKQFVRFATAAAQEAAEVPPGMPPVEAARAAVATAARDHAPGLAPGGPGGPGRPPLGPYRRTGRWVRRGRSIVLLGV